MMLLLLLNTKMVRAEAPGIQAISDRALQYAHVEATTIRSWEKRVRKAALLPRLQFGYDRHLKDFVNVGLQDSVSVSSTGVAVGPPAQTQTQNSDSDNNFEVKAVWFLDQLLFSKDDLDISAETRALAHEREKILDEVRQHYFKRQRGMQAMEALKKSHAPSYELEAQSLVVAEATAALDGLTGGWFSAELGEKP